MSAKPITFELSLDSPPTAHNSSNSAILRIPVEIREKVRKLCLTNVHIKISATRTEEALDKALQYWLKEKSYPALVAEPKAPIKRLNFVHTAQELEATFPVDHTLRKSITNIAKRSSTWQIPLLNRVCKQLANEDDNLLYHNSNLFSFTDYDTFRAFTISHPYSACRLPRLWLSFYQHAAESYATLAAEFIAIARSPPWSGPLSHQRRGEDIWIGAIYEFNEGRHQYEQNRRFYAEEIAFGSLAEVWIGSQVEELKAIAAGSGEIVQGRKESSWMTEAIHHHSLTWGAPRLTSQNLASFVLPYEKKRVEDAVAAWRELGVKTLVKDELH